MSEGTNQNAKEQDQLVVQVKTNLLGRHKCWLELSLKKIARNTTLQEMIGASSQHLSQGESGGPQSGGEQVSCLQREIKRGLVTYLSVPRTSFTMRLSSLRR
jgi:hypothetical protein